MSTETSVPSLVVRAGEGECSLAAGRAYLVGRDPQADIVTRPAQTRLLREAAARGCVPHPGMPMLAGQVDLILEFLGLTGHRPG